MEIALQIDEHIRQKLKDQELSLQYLNPDEIQIIGDPRRQLAVKLIFTFSGILLVSFSMIFAQGDGMNSLLFMIIGSAIGLLMMVLPFYNFYSKKQFRIFISKVTRKIEIKNNFNRGSISYGFSQIRELRVKSFKMDDFVNDETPGSTTYLCKFYLELVTSKEAALFTFSSRERSNLEKFSDAYGKYLSDFIGIPFRKIQE